MLLLLFQGIFYSIAGVVIFFIVYSLGAWTARQDKRNVNFEPPLIYLAWLCVFLGFVAALYGYYVTKHDSGGFSLQNLANLGSFGQGAVASIWSLAGLLFIFVAFLSQKKQMAQQEMELREQKKQFALQLKSIQLQSFENSFFQLLKLFNDTKLLITIRSHNFMSESTTHEGLQCFKVAQNHLTNFYSNTRLFSYSNSETPDLTKIKEAAEEHYNNFYRHHRQEFDGYFRQLYHIIKFVDSNDTLTNDEERRRYTSLVRAQLSQAELFLLFYNCICPHAGKFYPLIEKYGLLEHIDRTSLLHERHVAFYNAAYN